MKGPWERSEEKSVSEVLAGEAAASKYASPVELVIKDGGGTGIE